MGNKHSKTTGTSGVYAERALRLPLGGTATLENGRVMTQRQLYLAAIEQNPSLSEAYNNLAACLPADETVTLADGRVMTQRQLYLAAIEQNPSLSEAYCNLAACLPAGETVTFADGRVMTQRQLYIAAIEQNPSLSEAYKNLAACLPADETVTLADGRVMTQRQLYVAAIGRDAANAAAHYYNLSQTMLPSSSVSVTFADGRTLTREGCLLEAYQLDPDAAIGAAAVDHLHSGRVTFSGPMLQGPMTFGLLDSCDLVLSRLAAAERRISLGGVGLGLVRGKNLAACGFVEGNYEVEVVGNGALSIVEPSSDVAVVPFSDLHLVECLNRGGFGEVWKAHYKGSIVAVKKPVLQVSGADACLRRELAILMRIPPHCNIIGVIGRVPQHLNDRASEWIVLEYADRSLRQATSTLPRCSEAFIVSIAKQLCSALQHLHARRVYHLDLKLDNVLLVGDVVKLCDFGLSRLYEPGTKSRVISKEMGTPNFAAPELFDRGVGTLSAHSDVYGLGATLWAAVTGEAPWAGLTIFQIVGQMVQSCACPSPLTAHPDCGCSPQLNSLIEWCMKLSPAERPKLDQVAAALDAMT